MLREERGKGRAAGRGGCRLGCSGGASVGDRGEVPAISASEGGREGGDSEVQRKGFCGLCNPSGMEVDIAVTPLQPARSKAVSPAAFCGSILRGGVAA
jgi:hypothetical protein